MVWWSFAQLTGYGSGYVFSNVLVDILVSIVLCMLAKKVLFPALKGYRFAKELDRLFGTDTKHWFYGHAKKYGFGGEGFLNLSRMCWKFPSTLNIWLGPFTSLVYTFHPDTTISVLGSGAPKNEFGYRFIRSWLGDGLLTSKGKKWHRNRRLLTPAFHYKILRPYIEVFNTSAEVLIEKWKNEVGNPVEVSEPLSLLTLDTMMQCAMSQKTDCQNTRSKHPYIEGISELATPVVKRVTTPHYLLDWIFYRTEDGKRFNKAVHVVHSFTEQIIKQRRQETSKTNTLDEQDDGSFVFKQRNNKLLDFLDILLQTRDEDGKGLTDSEIRDEVDTFLFEGHDTTASGLTWIVFNLAKYTDLQNRCRDEVLSVVKDKEAVEWDDLPKLTYLTMFIKESMRLYPPVPSISRKLEEPLQLTHSKTPEKVMPAGSTVTVNIFCQHRNGHIWEDPLAFDPERFTTENIAKRSPHAYIPFSAGSRNCIGQNFAMNEIKVVLAQLMRSFQFYLDENTPEPIPIPRVTLKSNNEIVVKFKEAN